MNQNREVEKKRVLILGCGQFYRGDDAIGLIVARRLMEENLPEGWEVRLSQAPLDDLLDSAGNYDRIFLVDAMMSGQFEPGTVRRLERDRWPQANFRKTSGHSFSLPEAVALLQQIEPELQCEIVILGIEVSAIHISRLELSEEISSRIPIILKSIRQEIFAGVS